MTTNDDVSANDIPDILAGTIGTEQAAIQNDPNAVMAALGQDPNLLQEVLQPGFVELVNELAGDAAPTLGSVETVGQAYQDSNNESMSDAYNDLLSPGGQSSEDLNPQPLPPGPEAEIQQIEQQLEQLEDELNPQPLPPAEQDFSSFETAQAEPYSAAEGEFGGGQMEPDTF
jgi:hypothetical protein